MRTLEKSLCERGGEGFVGLAVLPWPRLLYTENTHERGKWAPPFTELTSRGWGRGGLWTNSYTDRMQSKSTLMRNCLSGLGQHSSITFQ